MYELLRPFLSFQKDILDMTRGWIFCDVDRGKECNVKDVF